MSTSKNLTKKNLSKLTAEAVCVALDTLEAAEQEQLFTLYDERTKFESQLGNSIVDNYENPGYFKNNKGDYSYIEYHSDASMSSVLGETRYKTTGFMGTNIVYVPFGNSNHGYCAGCNESFLLDFTQTSVGNEFGVFGVAFDLLIATNYSAHVVFGDNSQQDFSLTGKSFWGITSDQKIKSIHLDFKSGGTTQDEYITIDNLTIGSQAKPESAPEPGLTLGLLMLVANCTASMLEHKKALLNTSNCVAEPQMLDKAYSTSGLS